MEETEYKDTNQGDKKAFLEEIRTPRANGEEGCEHIPRMISLETRTPTINMTTLKQTERVTTRCAVVCEKCGFNIGMFYNKDMAISEWERLTIIPV